MALDVWDGRVAMKEGSKVQVVSNAKAVIGIKLFLVYRSGSQCIYLILSSALWP